MTDLRLDTRFREKANQLFNEIKSIIAPDSGLWEKDLQTAINLLEQKLTENQLTTIMNSASSTLFIGIQERNSLSIPLSHAFTDPIKKKQSLISAIGDEYDFLDDKETLKALLSLRKILEDNIHNYSLLLGEDMPVKVQDILNKYKDRTIPQLNEMISQLSNDSNINTSSIKLDNLTGNEHLDRLPDNIFE